MAMYDVEFTRHLPLGPFAFDEIKLRATVADVGEMATTALQFKTHAASYLPYDPAVNPDPPVERLSATPATEGTTDNFNVQLAIAEATICPCGETKGQSLGTVSDKDLEYLHKSYKKSEDIRNAAMTVLVARRQGRTYKK